MAIPASYESRCPICDEMIAEGEMIENVDEDWAHENCARGEGYLEDDRERSA